MLLCRDGKDGVGIGTDEHKARLAQRKQPCEPVEQVHGHAHQGIDGPLLQHGDQHGGGGIHGEHIVQEIKQHI